MLFRVILLTAILASAVLAQPTFSNITTRAVTHSSFVVEWTASANTTSQRIEFDSTVSTPPFANSTHNYAPSPATTNGGLSVSGLAPNTLYYWRICATAGGIEGCSPVQQTTTAQAPADRFSDPATPDVPTYPGLPQSYAHTFAVSQCSELQTALNNAAAVNDSGDVLVSVEKSLDCAGTFTIPSRAAGGTGYIVVRTNAPDSALPPPGYLITPAWADNMPKIRNNNFNSGTSSSAALRWTTRSDKWIFVGIYFSEAFPTSLVKSVSNVNGSTWTVPAHDWSTNDVINACIDGVMRRHVKINVSDSDTFSVIAEGPSGTCSTANGNWATRNQVRVYGLVHLFDGVTVPNPRSTGVWFDRCIFRLDHWVPTTLRIALQLWCTDCGLVGSYFERTNDWRSTDPQTGAVYTPGGSLHGETTAIGLAYADGVRIENTYVDSPGISIFADEVNGSAPNARDVLLKRVTHFWPTSLMLGSPDSIGYKVSVRQQLELKRGERFQVIGNRFINSWYGGITGNSGNAIVATPRCATSSTGVNGSANLISDFRIEYNSFERVSGVINLAGAETTNRPCATALTRKFLFRQNYVTLIDGHFRDITSAGRAWGNFIYWLHGVEDAIIENNTIADQRGGSPAAIYYIGSKSSGLRWRNNLLPQAMDNNSGGIFYTAAGVSGLLPAINTSSAATRIGTLWWAAPNADPAVSFERTAIIPTLTDTQNANYDSAGYTLANCQSYWSGLSGFTCIGTASTTTANQRLDLVKWFNRASGDLRLRHDSPFVSGSASTQFCSDNPGLCIRSTSGHNLGADYDAIQAATGRVRNVRIVPTSITSSSAKLAFTRPADSACTVEYGTSATPGTGTRVVDGGSTGGPMTAYLPVTVDLDTSGLSGTVHVRLLCPVEQQTLSFVKP